MKRKLWLLTSGIVLILAMLLTLGGCIWPPGTGTICVRSMLCWGKEITALYIYPDGTTNTSNQLSAPLEWFEDYQATGLEPGSWTVHAVIDSGPSWAEETVIVSADHIQQVSFYDADIR